MAFTLSRLTSCRHSFPRPLMLLSRLGINDSVMPTC
ncbi:hypothetical protein LINPERPRIM_LOCUS27824 [Linum perenne]